MTEYRICTYVVMPHAGDTDDYKEFYPEGRRFFYPCKVYIDNQKGYIYKHEPVSFRARHEWERDLRIEIERVHESLDKPVLDIDNKYKEYEPNN